MVDWSRQLASLIGSEQPTEHVAVFIPREDGRALRLAAQTLGASTGDAPVAADDWTVPLEGSVCGRVFRTGMATLVADVAMDPEYISFPGSRTRSLLAVPVGSPGAVVAVIKVEAPWVAAFSIRDYDRLTLRAEEALHTFPTAAPA